MGAISVRGIVIALAAIVAIASAASARAETGPWSSPTPLTGWGNRIWSWFPAIAADVFGNVHVVWAGGGEGLGDDEHRPPPKRLSEDAAWLTYTRWDGRRWSTPSDIAATVPSGNALRSALAADRSGHLHLFYRGLDLSAPIARSAETEALRYSTVDGLRAERAPAWSPGTPLSRRAPAYFPDIAVDSRGTLHAIWTEFDGESSYGVYYRRSKDGGQTWSPSYALEGVRPAHRWRMQLVVGPADDLHAVWEVVDPTEATTTATATLGFVYARSNDGGLTWSRRAFLPSQVRGRYERTFEGTGWRQQPALAIDRRGQVLVVWREHGTNVIQYQRSADGAAWSAPQPLRGIARGIARPFDRYDMATDSDGYVHLVVAAHPTASAALALVHTEWNGGGWSEPRIIDAGGPLRVPEWPRIAVANGNELHVVWFAGDTEQAGRTPVGLWHSTARSSARFVPPVPRRHTTTAGGRSASDQAASPVRAPHVEPRAAPAQRDVSDLTGYESFQSTATRALAVSMAAILVLLFVIYSLRRLRSAS